MCQSPIQVNLKRWGRRRTMQVLAPLVPTLAVVLPDATWMLSPERFTRRESRRSWPSSRVLKLYPSLNAAYCAPHHTHW